MSVSVSVSECDIECRPCDLFGSHMCGGGCVAGDGGVGGVGGLVPVGVPRVSVCFEPVLEIGYYNNNKISSGL